jgi:hypothetical protein
MQAHLLMGVAHATAGSTLSETSVRGVTSLRTIMTHVGPSDIAASIPVDHSLIVMTAAHGAAECAWMLRMAARGYHLRRAGGVHPQDIMMRPAGSELRGKAERSEFVGVAAKLSGGVANAVGTEAPTAVKISDGMSELVRKHPIIFTLTYARAHRPIVYNCLQDGRASLMLAARHGHAHEVDGQPANDAKMSDVDKVQRAMNCKVRHLA